MYLIFFNYYPFDNISIADIGLMLFVARHIRDLNRIHAKDVRRIAILFLGFVAVGGMSYSKQYFLVSSFLSNSLRVVFYGITFMIISKQIRSGRLQLLTTLRKSFSVLIVAVIIETLLQQFGVFWSYFIPGWSQNTSANTTFFRPSAFFDEPSYLSIYCVLSYFVLSYAKIDGYRWRLMSIACTLLSQSFSGLVGLAWVIYRDDFLWRRYLKTRETIVLPIVTAGVCASPIFFGRLEQIRQGFDGSTSHRVLGSLELTEKILSEYPLVGIGLGQFKTWLSARTFDLENHFFMASLDTGSGINNGFLFALGTAGLIGLLTYIYFMVSLSRDKGFLILAVWLGFSWGYILHPFMFVFYSIVNGLTSFRTKNPIGFGKLLPTYGRGQRV